MNGILEMREKRGQIWDRAKAFLKEHQDENGMLSAGDAAEYERMEQEVIELGRVIDRAERAAQMERELNTPTMTPLASRPETHPNSRPGRGSDEYKAAFWTAMRNRGGHFSVQNALQIGDDAEGGTACAACARSSAPAPATARSRWWPPMARRAGSRRKARSPSLTTPLGRSPSGRTRSRP